MAISSSLRFSVFERDGFTCQYCGRKPPEIEVHADHITPTSAGGDDRIDNLITACVDCNRGKGARIINPSLTHDELKKTLKSYRTRLRLLENISEAANGIIYQKDQIHWIALRRWLKAIGRVPAEGKNWECPNDIYYAIRAALAKNSLDEVLDAIDITMGREHLRSGRNDNSLKYFYGVLRNIVLKKELEE